MAISELMYDEIEDENGEIVLVPLKYYVCGQCEGKGTCVNPSIGAITQSEWAEWDPEEREGYFNGVYDVQCDRCEGKRVAKGPAWEEMDDKTRELYQDHLNDLEAMHRQIEAERRFGC